MNYRQLIDFCRHINYAEPCFTNRTILQNALNGLRPIEIEVPGRVPGYAGDGGGRTANVILMGALSRVTPVNAIDPRLWLKVLEKISPSPALGSANYNAFMVGKALL